MEKDKGDVTFMTGGVHASMVCVVHGLSRSGEGGREGRCHRGMREVGE
jgi:hypothetical protein